MRSRSDIDIRDGNWTPLGDSVYANVDSGMITIVTESLFGIDNIIYLEPEVFLRLKEMEKKFSKYKRS